jgi:hypothetical protein
MLRWLQTTAGRALTGLTAMAAIVVFLWPVEGWRFDPSLFAACALSFVAWLASLGETKRPTAHDVELLKQFRALISDQVRSTLRSHDFGGSYSRSWVSGLNEVAYWRGAEFEFDDRDLQARFAKVVEKISAFTHDLALETWPTNMGDLSTAIPDAERGGVISERTKARVEKLNTDASTVVTAVDDFIRFARPRLDSARD